MRGCLGCPISTRARSRRASRSTRSSMPLSGTHSERLRASAVRCRCTCRGYRCRHARRESRDRRPRSSASPDAGRARAAGDRHVPEDGFCGTSRRSSLGIENRGVAAMLAVELGEAEMKTDTLPFRFFEERRRVRAPASFFRNRCRCLPGFPCNSAGRTS